MSDFLSNAIGSISFDQEMLAIFSKFSDNEDMKAVISEMSENKETLVDIKEEEMITEFLSVDDDVLAGIMDFEEMLQSDENNDMLEDICGVNIKDELFDDFSEVNENEKVLAEIRELNDLLKVKQMTLTRQQQQQNTPIVITVPGNLATTTLNGSNIKILEHQVTINGVIFSYEENEMNPIISVISKVFHCDLCNKDFTKSGSFVQHNNTHHSGKEHKCGTCGKRFETEAVLNFHKKNHEETAKNFMCPQCPKGYVHKSDLKRHVLTHVGNDKKPFHCDECSKGFTRKDHLVNHKKSHARKSQLKFAKMQKKVQ